MVQKSTALRGGTILLIIVLEFVYLWIGSKGGNMSSITTSICFTLLLVALPLLWFKPRSLKKAAFPMVFAVFSGFAAAVSIMDRQFVAIFFVGIMLYCLAIASRKRIEGPTPGQNALESRIKKDPLSPNIRDGFSLAVCVALTVWLWPRSHPTAWGVPLMLPPFWFIWRLGIRFFGEHSAAVIGGHESQ
jgi:hypothetical protein